MTKSGAKNLVRAYQTKDAFGNALASMVFLLFSIFGNVAHVFVAINSCDVIFYECMSCVLNTELLFSLFYMLWLIISSVFNYFVGP